MPSLDCRLDFASPDFKLQKLNKLINAVTYLILGLGLFLISAFTGGRGPGGAGRVAECADDAEPYTAAVRRR